MPATPRTSSRSPKPPDSELEGELQHEWFERLEHDLPNFRTAFAWGVDNQPGDAVRIAYSLRALWFVRGHLIEGRQLLSDALAAYPYEDHARIHALNAASILASIQGDWPESKQFAEQSRELSTQLGDPTLSRESLLTLGRVRIAEGDPDAAIRLFAEAEAAAAACDDVSLLGMARFNAGYLELTRGDYQQAELWLEAARETLTPAGHHHGAARSLAALGSVALHQQRQADAERHLRQSIELARTVGDHGILAWALELLGVNRATTDPATAARLLGAAEALRGSLGSELEGIELALHLSALKVLARPTSPPTGRRAVTSHPTKPPPLPWPKGR